MIGGERLEEHPYLLEWDVRPRHKVTAGPLEARRLGRPNRMKDS
jgi:hypothetical protein